MNPHFSTRIDEIGAKHARFYFSDAGMAEAFAATHDSTVAQSSPIGAGGGLWMVPVPYTSVPAAGRADVGTLPLSEFISESVDIGRSIISRDQGDAA